MTIAVVVELKIPRSLTRYTIAQPCTAITGIFLLFFFAPTKVLIDIRLQCGGFNARKHFLSFSNAGQMSPAARSRIDDWGVKLLGGDNHRVYARFFGKKKKKKKKSLCGCCWFSKTSQQRASPRRPFLTVTSPAYSDVTLLRAGTFLWCENESAYTRPIIL